MFIDYRRLSRETPLCVRRKISPIDDISTGKPPFTDDKTLCVWRLKFKRPCHGTLHPKVARFCDREGHSFTFPILSFPQLRTWARSIRIVNKEDILTETRRLFGRQFPSAFVPRDFALQYGTDTFGHEASFQMLCKLTNRLPRIHWDLWLHTGNWLKIDI